MAHQSDFPGRIHRRAIVVKIIFVHDRFALGLFHFLVLNPLIEGVERGSDRVSQDLRTAIRTDDKVVIPDNLTDLVVARLKTDPALSWDAAVKQILETTIMGEIVDDDG